MKQTLETLLQLQKLDDSLQHETTTKKADTLRSRLSETVLTRYDRFRSRGRKSVARVGGNGVCGGCHMKLSSGLIAHLQRGEELQVCEHCGRYIVLDAVHVDYAGLTGSTTNL